MIRNTRKNPLTYFGIFFIVIAFFYTFNVTTSRYMGQLSANDDIIAQPVLTLSNNKATYTIEDMFPGLETTYEFQVSNSENGKINEVLLDYHFSVNIGSEIPIKTEIYEVMQGGEEKLLDLTDGKTENISMDYGEEVVKDYKLKIIWDKKDNNLQYASKKVTCNINLEAEQVV